MAAIVTIHDAATRGFDNAQKYDTHRPSYPPEAVQSLLGQLGLAGKAKGNIVDLAAGTGKFTELLAAREEGYNISAVEPLDSMIQVLASKGLPGVEVKKGTATDMPVEKGWADAVIVAQAFHWFAKEESLVETTRVLKDSGKLAMIWNVEDYNRPAAWPATTEWEEALYQHVVSVALDGQPRFRDDVWWQVFDQQAKLEKPLFATPIKTESVPWTVRATKEGLWDRVTTLSHIAVLEGDERARYRSKFDEIVAAGLDKNGELEFHGVCYFAWTEKL